MIETLLLLSLIVFVTHGLEAVTGFGCTVLAFPFVIAVTGDIVFSKIILTILAWVLALFFVVTNFKKINWRQFILIAVFAGVGIPVGILAFKNLNSALLTKILGGFIVLSAGIQIYKLYFQRTVQKISFSPFNYLYLILGGVVHGAFATGGPLIVLYSTKKLIDKGEFRVTMCLLWTVLNAILIVHYLIDGKLTEEVGISLLALLPALVLGIVAGGFVHNRVNELLFKKIVFITLFVVGVFMLLT
jgi:uncharacterized membrane protein YfcA